MVKVVLNKKDLQFITQSELFLGISPKERDRLLEKCQLQAFHSDHILFRAGHPVNHIFLILEGLVQLFRGEDDGKHAILGLRVTGEVAGLSAAVSGNSHYSSAQSTGRCRVLEVPLSIFSQLLKHAPDLERRLTRRLAGNLQDISKHIERLQLMQTTERLASYLLTLVPKQNGSIAVTLPCDKGVIATYLGMERESLSRSLKKLRSVGVVSKGRKIQISDPVALKGLCEP